MPLATLAASGVTSHVIKSKITWPHIGSVFRPSAARTRFNRIRRCSRRLSKRSDCHRQIKRSALGRSQCGGIFGIGSYFQKVERNTWTKANQMISVLLYIFLGLLCLKLLWNVSIPFWSRNSTGGISLMPLIEVLLLGLAVLIRYLANGPSWIETSEIIQIGFGGIFASYLLMWLFGFAWSKSRHGKT